eukprot:COSAG01_NODE_55125_length_327_cov_0.885965_1_plen_76_part_10
MSFDFGSPKTLVGFRYTGAGDSTHDAKGIKISVGPSKTGPWNIIAEFEGKEGKPKGNSWRKIWQEFEFPPTKSQHW